MATDISTTDTTHRAATTVTDWFKTAYPESTPLVRYGFPREEGGQKQELKLRSLYEPIPENAITSSAIYFVTDSQRTRLEKFADRPYEIEGSQNIVKEIQSECEDADRVRYPVYAESDARDDNVNFVTMIGWIQQFVEDELSVSPDRCTFWYSGSRSIHVHLPKFLSHDQLTVIKDQAERFCQESQAQLDTGIYKPKQQFRLPGVTHRKSAGALQKVQIDPSWRNDRIIRTAADDHPLPASYLEMLTTTFTPQVGTEGFALSLDTPDEKNIETPLIERVEYPENAYDVPKWAMYNTKEFSPYAHATGNPRSVAVVEIKGGAFTRKGRRNEAPMIPVWFYGAVSCDGEFTKETKHGALQLSEGKRKDYEKWIQQGFQAGDHAVVIGGQSRSSIIHPIEKKEALRAGFQLIRENGGRDAARKYLSDQGYNVGASGSNSTTASRGRNSSDKAKEIWPARENPPNKAEEFQLRAEREGIDQLGYPEINRIAHRLLRFGWNPTWRWFKEQFGEQFNPKETWEHLRSIVKEEDYDEYDHIEVPKKPM